MVEYTWDDIIINPNDERLKDAIGKEVFISCVSTDVLETAKRNKPCFILKKIRDYTSCYPFICEEGIDGTFIILKKEEPKEYVPFESAEEFVESYYSIKKAYCYGTFEHNLVNSGIWIKKIFKNNHAPLLQVLELWEDGIVTSNNCYVTRWDELIESYQFLDGTPCGKLKDGENLIGLKRNL